MQNHIRLPDDNYYPFADDTLVYLLHNKTAERPVVNGKFLSFIRVEPCKMIHEISTVVF